MRRIASVRAVHAETMETTLWPEDVPPRQPIPCDTCELADHSPILVWGEGTEAPLWILLDNPGARATHEGSPFVCGTRQTLYEIVSQSGLAAKDCYLTFVVRRRPRRAYDKNNERRRCFMNFQHQREALRPRAVICLGNIAIQSFLSAPDAHVTQYRQTWTAHAGTWMTASYHPLAVRRRPYLASTFTQDWTFVRETFPTLPTPPLNTHSPSPELTS
ncbi:uracil-DNA glycosylase family protein [Sulfobacillus harzensis]|uniref:Uracil-DNA glycosylase n=1 Tax=Sulfobacillus harzensis TaxID=2729629 RepID=A0A7Y0Q4H9_9FIRM|nr:uracil-DNA glycosylase family protein [Sulfobacillus harzensis]NMP23269.1 uracil-DNA glycosylase [Sulfobacillus harzensis]